MIASNYCGLKSYSSSMLDSFSIDKLFVEIYEEHIFSYDFHPIRRCMFRLSFLTMLNIYKDYFKTCHNYASRCNLMQNFFISILWLDICPSLSFSWRNYCVCTPLGFVTKEFCDLHRLDELKNFATNILLKLVINHVLGSMHRLVSHVLWDVHWKWEIVTTEQV